MLDIKIIRENPEKVNELLKRRNPDLSIDEILEILAHLISVSHYLPHDFFAACTF